MRLLTWDYKLPSNFTFGTQLDWNQTLATKINEASAAIHMKKLNSPATHIKLNISLFPLIKNMEYFKKMNDGDLILGKYKIILDDTVAENEIIVFDKTDSDLEASIKIIIKNL